MFFGKTDRFQSQFILTQEEEEEETQEDTGNSTTSSENDDSSSGDDTVGGARIRGSTAGTASILATIAAAEERRRRVRRRQTAEGTSGASTTATHTSGKGHAPRLRDPLGAKPPWRKPEPDSRGRGGGRKIIVDPVQLVWDNLSARHQCFIDRWPPEVVSDEEQGEREAGSDPSPQVRKWERE